MENKRSEGTFILCILTIIYGFWGIVFYLRNDIRFINYYFISHFIEENSILVVCITYYVVITNILIIFAFIISGIYVLKMRNWARILIIIVSLMQLINGFVIPFLWKKITSSSIYFNVIIPNPIEILFVINIWFFNQKKIKEQFKKISN